MTPSSTSCLTFKNRKRLCLPALNIILLTAPDSNEPLTDKPIKPLLEQTPEIPRKPKAEPPQESAPQATNGTHQTNGKHTADEEASAGNLKRPREGESDVPAAKKAKVASAGGDDVVLVDDQATNGGGAIVIDD